MAIKKFFCRVFIANFLIISFQYKNEIRKREIWCFLSFLSGKYLKSPSIKTAETIDFKLCTRFQQIALPRNTRIFYCKTSTSFEGVFFRKAIKKQIVQEIFFHDISVKKNHWKLQFCVFFSIKFLNIFYKVTATNKKQILILLVQELIIRKKGLSLRNYYSNMYVTALYVY